MDLMLLATTYLCCRLYGLEWYLITTKQLSAAVKKKDDDKIDKSMKDGSGPIHSVWDLAMIALPILRMGKCYNTR